MVHAVRGVSLTIDDGEWAALIGPSGSGKSTLLNLITGLDRPTQGTILTAGTDLTRLNQEQLAIWRSRTIGIVFQFFQLLPTLTALENVILPLELAGDRANRRQRARALLEAVGVASVAERLPSDLSGGEQQRVAVARALVNRPRLVVADEPTGNLDAENGAAVLNLLKTYWQQGGTLLLVTHDAAVADQAERIIALEDGRLVADSRADARLDSPRLVS